jgi:hypothetical protein
MFSYFNININVGAVWINYVDLVEYYLKVGRFRGINSSDFGKYVNKACVPYYPKCVAQ